MANFTLREAAKRDLKRIAVYTGQRWGRKQRNRYLTQIDASFHQLADNPETGTRCDYIHEGYRKFPVSSHVIFYKIGKDGAVEIIRILHKRMDVTRTFSNGS